MQYDYNGMPYKSDNIIHFQDPRSAKFNGQLNKPLTKTKNERNYTSYNFIKQEANKHQPQTVRFHRRISVEKHREQNEIKGAI